MNFRNIEEQTRNMTPESLEIQRYLDSMLHHRAKVMEVSSHALVMLRLEPLQFPQRRLYRLTHGHRGYQKTLAEYLGANGPTTLVRYV